MRNAARDRSVHRRLVAAGTVVLLSLVAVAPGMAQDSEQPSIPTPLPTPQPTPIPASDIPARAAADADTARQAVADAEPDARLQDIQESFPAEQARIKTLREETTKQLKKDAGACVDDQGNRKVMGASASPTRPLAGRSVDAVERPRCLS